MQETTYLLVFLFPFAAFGCLFAAYFALSELRKGNRKIIGWQITFILSGFAALALLSSILYATASLLPK